MMLLLTLLFCCSGFAALVYEVLWLKELGLLFGNTSHASAVTLAAFFLGLAAGAHYWSGRAQTALTPLRLYGYLELGVICGAAGYFALLPAYAELFPWLFKNFAGVPVLFSAVKFVLAVTLLFPSAFCMGGTLPAVSRMLPRVAGDHGWQLSWLYACNTLGAVFGVLLAGFYLPARLGYRGSYQLTMAITFTVAVIAMVAGGLPQHRRETAAGTAMAAADALMGLTPLAACSGFLALALQVLWIRMFAQVLQNSLYTFALVLAVFLAFLALAAAVVNSLAVRRAQLRHLMLAALAGGALLVSLTPFLFHTLTDGLHFVAGTGWNRYLLNIAVLAAVVMGPPLLCLGMVFPLLLELGGAPRDSGEIAIGRLLAWNTLGAILGALAAGFVLLEAIGLWAGIRFCAVGYWLLAGYWLLRTPAETKRWLLLPAGGILLSVSLLDSGRLPVVRFDAEGEQESLLRFWEGSAATVAVLRSGEHLKIKVNNYYTLGGTGSYELERLQGYLPLLLHQRPRTVFFLGLGTGISAGAALAYPLETLRVAELLPEVALASEQYFGAYNNGLFYDPRARVMREDGRNYLRGTDEYFDVIVSDLFVPWNAGTGSLYTLEHYRQAAAHLRADGLFMQWLPAYQLHASEFYSIAKTMRQAFSRVTVWRGSFNALTPVIGLLGERQQAPLSPQARFFNARINKGEQPLLSYYAGNLDAVPERMQTARVNSDDYPLIELQAPQTQQQVKAGQAQWFTGAPLLEFMQALHDRQGADTFLAQLPVEKRLLSAAGLHLQQAQWLRYQGLLQGAKQHLQAYEAILKNAETTPEP